MTSSHFNQRGGNFANVVDDYTYPLFIGIAMRAPSSQDIYPSGTKWQDNSVTPPVIYQTTGAGIWVSDSGGSGVFTSLTVTPGSFDFDGTTADFQSSGAITMQSNLDGVGINIIGNGGTTGQIAFQESQGTAPNSVVIRSVEGGVTVSGGLATNDSINLEGGPGGVDIDAQMQINIESTQIAGDAIVINASNAAGGIDLMAGTGNISCNTNFVLNTAATQIQMTGGAATDFIGTATLVAGTVTVANTNITANDRIMITRRSINGSTALGSLTYSITPATSFTITSVDPATPANTQTNDVSIIDYVIVREI